MEEFEDEQMRLAINLEKYEKEKIQSIEEFNEPNTEERMKKEETAKIEEIELIEQIGKATSKLEEADTQAKPKEAE